MTKWMPALMSKRQSFRNATSRLSGSPYFNQLIYSVRLRHPPLLIRFLPPIKPTSTSTTILPQQSTPRPASPDGINTPLRLLSLSSEGVDIASSPMPTITRPDITRKPTVGPIKNSDKWIVSKAPWASTPLSSWPDGPLRGSCASIGSMFWQFHQKT